jgi:hypothetical protein
VPETDATAVGEAAAAVGKDESDDTDSTSYVAEAAAAEAAAAEAAAAEALASEARAAEALDNT